MALALLAAGVYRQSVAQHARREDEAVLAQKEREVEEQEERIESARRSLEEYLAVLGAEICGGTEDRGPRAGPLPRPAKEREGPL